MMKDVNRPEVEHIVSLVLKELGHDKPASALRQDHHPERLSEPPESTDPDCIYFSEEKEWGIEHPHNEQALARARSLTPARIGIGRAGTRMKTKSYLQFRLDQAAAHDAVFKEVSPRFLEELGLPILHTQAETMEQYLMDLDSGRRLSEESEKWLKAHAPKGKQVQIIVSDGLSSSAIEANIKDLLPALIQGLELKKISLGQPVFIKRGRVWVQDQVAAIVNCDVVISLIGERPGLATAESLSAYLIYRPNQNSVESDRTVIANIHKGGLPPVEAGAYLADLIEDILRLKVSGVKYTQLREGK